MQSNWELHPRSFKLRLAHHTTLAIKKAGMPIVFDFTQNSNLAKEIGLKTRFQFCDSFSGKEEFSLKFKSKIVIYS